MERGFTVMSPKMETFGNMSPNPLLQDMFGPGPSGRGAGAKAGSPAAFRAPKTHVVVILGGVEGCLKVNHLRGGHLGPH